MDQKVDLNPFSSVDQTDTFANSVNPDEMAHFRIHFRNSGMKGSILIRNLIDKDMIETI